MVEPTIAAELAHKIAAGSIDIIMRARQIGRAPRFDFPGKRAMALVEERPAKKASVRH
jgi:hypothetical protein